MTREPRQQAGRGQPSQYDPVTRTQGAPPPGRQTDQPPARNRAGPPPAAAPPEGRSDPVTVVPPQSGPGAPPAPQSGGQAGPPPQSGPQAPPPSSGRTAPPRTASPGAAPTGSTPGPGTMRPPVDVIETAESLDVIVDVPGFDDDEITLEADVRSIRIAATRSVESDDDAVVHARERPTRFERVVPITVRIELDDAEATYEDGVCRVTFPKA